MLESRCDARDFVEVRAERLAGVRGCATRLGAYEADVDGDVAEAPGKVERLRDVPPRGISENEADGGEGGEEGVLRVVRPEEGENSRGELGECAGVVRNCANAGRVGEELGEGFGGYVTIKGLCRTSNVCRDEDRKIARENRERGRTVVFSLSTAPGMRENKGSVECWKRHKKSSAGSLHAWHTRARLANV